MQHRTIHSILISNFFKRFSHSIVLVCTIVLIASTAWAQSGNERQLADQYYNNYEYDKAVAIYDKVFDKDPFGVYNNYLRSLAALKDYDEAEKLIKKITKKNPNNPGYLVDLGWVYESKGDPGKARQQYEKAIKSLQPDQGQVIMLANAFFQYQNWDHALATYLAGKKMLRGFYGFYFEAAEVYFQKQDYEKMIDEYLDAVAENQMMLQNVQNVLQARIGNDPENSRTNLLRQSLLRRTQKNPDQVVFSEMLIWLFVQQKDFESAFIQAKAIDKRQREEGGRVMTLGTLSDANKDYDVAIKCYQYIIDKGNNLPFYVKARMEMLGVRNRKITDEGNYTKEDLLRLEGEYRKTLAELGKDGTTAPLVKGLAHLQAFYLDSTDAAAAALEEAIEYPDISRGVQAQCKLELGDIYLFTGNVWDSDLLYAQVDKAFKNDPLGQEAKFRSARLDYFRGDFLWAQAQLDVLKSATSQLIANDALSLALLISDNMGPDSTNEPLMDYSRADLLSYRNRKDDAFNTLDSLLLNHPDHSLVPYAIYKKALILDDKRNYALEDSLLREVGEKYADGVLADDALFRRAELYEKRFNQKEKAMELYQDLLTKFPGSLYVVDARKRFRALRGDVVN